jgi:hypothetical protein
MRGAGDENRFRPGETVVEILKSFEQAAGRFSPMVLIVPGLAMVALGLIAWLAGMCVRRLVLAFVGAAAGGLAGFFAGGQNPAIAGVAAAGGAIVVAALPRLSFAVLFAVLGVAVVFGVMTRAQLIEGQRTFSGRQDAGRGEEALTVPQSLNALRILASDVGDCIKSATGNLDPAGEAILAAVGAGLLLGGLLLVRLTGAFVCSVLGAALIFSGLIALLILKGSAPIALVQKQGAFYGLVLLGMTAFGTLEQLVLCPPPKRRHKDKSGGAHPKEESGRSWRSS